MTNIKNLKVSHAFVPLRYNKTHPYSYIIEKELMYVQLLSCLLAKRAYGNIDFYTNQDVYKTIEDLELPYTNINTDLLKDIETKSFGVYKMKVYEILKDPFLFIDTDVLIYKKIELENCKENILFAHPDQPIRINKNLNEIYAKNFSEVYAGFFYSFFDQHSNFKKQNLNISDIPNMCIIYGNNSDTFKQATSISLEHHQKNKEIIDRRYYGSAYVEQLMIHLNMMEIDEIYKNVVKKGNHFFGKDRLLEIESKINNFNINNVETSFPLTFRINELDDIYTKKFDKFTEYQHDEIKSKKVTINTKNDLIKFFDFEFGGITHLSYMKKAPVFQCMCMGYIANHFGEEWLNKVNSHYKKIYPLFKLNEPPLSEGEKLYQELTGFKF